MKLLRFLHDKEWWNFCHNWQEDTHLLELWEVRYIGVRYTCRCGAWMYLNPNDFTVTTHEYAPFYEEDIQNTRVT